MLKSIKNANAVLKKVLEVNEVLNNKIVIHSYLITAIGTFSQIERKEVVVAATSFQAQNLFIEKYTRFFTIKSIVQLS